MITGKSKTERPATPCIVVDSVTDLTSDHAGAVVVAGSHGGTYPGLFALSTPVGAAVFSDAGRGRDDAGVAGLALLQRAGIPAAAASVMSAHIGSGGDVHTEGIISVVNDCAAGLGVRVDQSVREATRILCAAVPAVPVRNGVVPKEKRCLLTGTPVAVWVLDSASLVSPSDDGAIVITGSHGSAPGGEVERALKCTAALAAFNDAGVGKDAAGISRLPLLQARGVPAVTVAASSARIGEGMSTLNDGVISAVNPAAASLGAFLGQRLTDFVADLLEQYRGRSDDRCV